MGEGERERERDAVVTAETSNFHRKWSAHRGREMEMRRSQPRQRSSSSGKINCKKTIRHGLFKERPFCEFRPEAGHHLALLLGTYISFEWFRADRLTKKLKKRKQQQQTPATTTPDRSNNDA